MSYPKGDTADPAWRRERARKAGLAGNSLDGLIRRIIKRCSELTDEQVETLARIAEDRKAER